MNKKSAVKNSSPADKSELLSHEFREILKKLKRIWLQHTGFALQCEQPTASASASTSNVLLSRTKLRQNVAKEVPSSRKRTHDSTEAIDTRGKKARCNDEPTTNASASNVFMNRKKSSRQNVPEEVPTSRKRRRDPTQTIDARATRARCNGEAGTGRNGVIIRAKKVKPGCNQKCSKKCQLNITTDMRSKIHQEFWNLPEHHLKWQCISNWITKKNTSVFPDTDSESDSDSEYEVQVPKQGRLTYRLPDADGKLVTVCRKTFLGVLGMSKLILYIHKIRNCINF